MNALWLLLADQVIQSVDQNGISPCQAESRTEHATAPRIGEDIRLFVFFRPQRTDVLVVWNS